MSPWDTECLQKIGGMFPLFFVIWPRAIVPLSIFGARGHRPTEWQLRRINSQTGTRRSNITRGHANGYAEFCICTIA